MAKKERWYKDGLKFTCTQCGNCCSGDPGVVWVTANEQEAIARHLGNREGKLGPEHLRRVGWRYSLTEKADGDCVFLKREAGKAYCGIYDVRPTQCRTWPFWKELLKSRKAWMEGAENCPGMNEGTHYGFVEIEELRVRRS